MGKGKTIRPGSFGLYKPLQRLVDKVRKPKQTYIREKVKKYLVISGFIHSINDKDEHYISARRLVDLYRVRLEDCILIYDVKSPDFFHYRNCKDLIWLMPQSSGDYTMPKKEEG